MSRKSWMYLGGVAPLALFYVPIKAAMPSGAVFLAAAIVYLVGVRLVIDRFDA